MMIPQTTHPAPSLTRLQTFYGELPALPLLQVMIKREFSGEIALLSSFGADAALLLAMVAEIDPKTPVLFLETHKHFPETLAYVETLRQELGLENLRFLTPDPEKLGRIDATGTLWQHQPNRCCWLRKVEPLKRGIEEGGYRALITGRKRYQTDARGEMQSIELDGDGIFRINPLSGWTKEEVERERRQRNLPEHPLVAEGFLSIGCAPCTAPVGEGQGERAGRWAHTADDGTQKTECGLHVPEAADWTV